MMCQAFKKCSSKTSTHAPADHKPHPTSQPRPLTPNAMHHSWNLAYGSVAFHTICLKYLCVYAKAVTEAVIDDINPIYQWNWETDSYLLNLRSH